MRTQSVSALLFVLLLLGFSASVLADGFPEDCAGTFLTQEGSGAKSIWTFGQDGTFLGTSSTQKVFNFSNQQGVWQSDDGNNKGVFLDFLVRRQRRTAQHRPRGRRLSHSGPWV
jgi:hypothetical protein